MTTTTTYGHGGYRSNDSNRSSPDTETYEANISPNAIRLDLEEGANYDEDANAATSTQQHSRRRNIVTIISLIPLIGALIALGIVMTKQSSSDTTVIENGSSSYVMSSNVTDTVSVWDTSSSEVETITFTSSGVKQKEDILDSTELTVDIIDTFVEPTGSPSNEVSNVKRSVLDLLLFATYDMHIIFVI